MKIINTTVTLESSKLHLIHLMGEREREREQKIVTQAKDIEQSLHYCNLTQKINSN